MALAAGDGDGAELPVNAWAIALARLEESLYTDRPPPHFQTRLICLLCLAGIGLVGYFILLAILILDIRRSKGSLWILRRTRSGYIISNTKLLSCVTGIIGLTIVTLSTSSLQQTLVRNEFTHDTLTVACITRTIYIIPIVIHGYILTFGALQAFLARGDSSFRGEKPGRRLSPAVANTLFIAVGLLFVGGLAAASLYVAINGTHLYGHIILPLQARLAEGAAAWEAGERSASAFAAVLPMLEHAGVKGAHYAKSFWPVCTLTAANMAVFFVINTGSVVLARLVRRHVHHQLAASASSAAGLPTAPAPSTTHIALPFHPSPSRAHLAPNRLSSVMSNRSDVEQGRDLEKMSQREMKEIAGKTHTVEGVLAARVLQLLKAERALVVTASCLVAISVCATVLSAWVASTVVGSASYRTSVWGLQELFLTVYLWAYSVLLVMTLPSLLYKSIHALPPGSTIRRTTSANHTSLHEYWRGLCPFHRFYAWCTRRQRSSTSSAPPPPLGDGLAPTGRVRVVIAHEVQEDYLHDVNLSTDDRIVLHETKTTIRGGRDPINAVPPSIAVLHIDDSGRTVEVGGNGVLPDVGWTRPDWAMGQRGEEGLQSPAEEVRRGSSTSALPRISSLTGGVRWDWRLGPRKGLV